MKGILVCSVLFCGLLMSGKVVSAEEISDYPDSVKKAVQTIASWYDAHPVSMTVLKADGRYVGQPYTLKWEVFNYHNSRGELEWRLSNSITQPVKSEFVAFPTLDGKTMLYFANSKQVVKYDPSQNFILQIDDWFLRKQIDLQSLKTVISSASVEPADTLSELKFVFDPTKLRSAFQIPKGMALSLSLFFAPDGEIQRCSRVFNGETVNATVEHPSFDDATIVKLLPAIPSGNLQTTRQSFQIAVQQDAAGTGHKSRSLLIVFALLLLAPPGVLLISWARRKRNV